MSNKGSKEISRLRAEYARRDAAGLSSLYTYRNPAFAFHMQEREWAILRMLEEDRVNLAGARLLEVGCGTGHILERFLEFGAEKAVGIDLAEHRIRVAKGKYPNLLLLQGNAAELPFPGDTFDMAMQFMCLSSVLDPGTRQRIADEMWRVVRPGGLILYYDLRPIHFVARLLFLPFSLVKKFSSSALSSPGTGTAEEKEPPPTPVQCLTSRDIRAFFPKGLMRYRSVSLDYSLAGIAATSLLAAQLLSRIPVLRTHYLALIRKPS
jgi:ubiquinone/menaquinone biosynthesis C-methylase UbiE